MSNLGSPFNIALLKRKLNENSKNNNLELNILKVNQEIEIGDFVVKAIGTSHSIPDPISILISTPKGKIFHSGDWKLEHSSNLGEKINFQDFRSMGSDGILAMVCDSTNSLADGRTPSELYAYNGLFSEIKNKKNIVLTTCFSSNISRIKSLLDIIQKLIGQL